MPYFDPYDPANSRLQRAITGEQAPPTSNTMPIGQGGPANQAYNATQSAINGQPANTANQKRDQWSGAGTVTGGNYGNVEGFDQANWNNPEMQTAKYQAGRIFSRYNPNDPNALQAILQDAEFKSLFPNAKGMGPDKIDFGDGRPVDVIRGHGAPGALFSWQTEDAPSGVPSYQSHPWRGGQATYTSSQPLTGVPETAAQGAQGASSEDEMAAYYNYLQAVMNQGREQI